jgi:hypothetical protein
VTSVVLPRLAIARNIATPYVASTSPSGRESSLVAGGE